MMSRDKPIAEKTLTRFGQLLSAALLARAWISAVWRRQPRQIGQLILERYSPAAITLLVLAASSPVLEKAARRIEAHRKRDATIRVVRKDGTAVPAARVEVVQRSHDFLFGNVFRPRHCNNGRERHPQTRNVD